MPVETGIFGILVRTIELKALVIGENPSTLQEVEEACAPEVTFEYADWVNTAHKAVSYHMEMDFDLCFIDERFDPTELNSFFRDFKKLEKVEHCVFVQFRQKVSNGFDRSSLLADGFNTVITKLADSKDKAALWASLKGIIDKREHQEALRKLSIVVDGLVDEVNRVAAERKRGAIVKYGNIYSTFLRESTARFKGLAEDFYSKLSNATEQARPNEIVSVEIPQSVLAKNLPHLHKDTYSGQSRRVWQKLQRKHGKKKGASGNSVTVSDDASSQTTQENAESPTDGSAEDQNTSSENAD